MRLVVDANILFSFFKKGNDGDLKKKQSVVKAFSTKDLISFLFSTQ